MQTEKKEALNALQYFVFDGRQAVDGFIKEQGLLYETWKKGWEGTFQELSSDAQVVSPDFIRQSIVAGLFLNRSEVIGLQAYSIFNLNWNAHLEHPYFKTYPPKVFEILKNEGVQQVMTMEYLYVNPDWRRSVVGISLADVICSLGLRLFAASSAQAITSVTRNERKVNEMLYRKGAKCLASDLNLHNVAVDIIGFFKGQCIEEQNSEIEFVEKFWLTKNDPLGIALKSQAAA